MRKSGFYFLLCFPVALILMSFGSDYSAISQKNQIAVSGDSISKKRNPNLIYTTREYYFDVPANCMDNICLKDFKMIITYNIGVTMNDEIKELSFNDAQIDFSARVPSGKTFIAQKFSKFDYKFSPQGYKTTVTFYADKPATSSSTSVPKTIINKCVFEGSVKNSGCVGMLTFYLSNGEIAQVQFN